MALVVLMAHPAFDHIGHGFKTAVRMRGEARQIIAGIIGMEFVQHQERVKHPQIGRAQQTGELHPGAVRGRHALGDLHDRTQLRAHVWLLFRCSDRTWRSSVEMARAVSDRQRFQNANNQVLRHLGMDETLRAL
jgi:hypothetical protein